MPTDDPHPEPQPAAPAALIPGLHVVATPIGNLGDITQRAVQVLAAADVVAAEDTRVTGRLLHHLGLDRPLVAYHEHNAERMRPQLLARMAAGAAVALVSDAGTPLISDPGYRLVVEARAAGLPVTVVPGASALTCALAGAGQPTDRVLFAGFLPQAAGARQRAIAELADIPASLVLYESARRLPDALAALAEGLGADRPATVARELTKLHEEWRPGTLGGLAAHYAAAGAPRGEVVLVIGPPLPPPPADAQAVALALAAARSRLGPAAGTRALAAALAEATGLSRRAAYAAVMADADAGGDGARG